MAEQKVRVERVLGVARVTIARPRVHNAFDAETIALLGAAFEELGREAGVRAIVLAGDGKSFSAGGDLNWMKETAAYAFDDNAADAKRLARMLEVVDRNPKPVIARVHGAALGGGCGLLAACDVAIASTRAVFGFSEVRLGLLPAVISPFVVRRVGPAAARALMLTGERFDARKALRLGLVDEVWPPEALDAMVEARVRDVLQGGPRAQAAIKALVRGVAGKEPGDVAALTARMIAETRASEEGAEGVAAFLEKRSPAWRAES